MSQLKLEVMMDMVNRMSAPLKAMTTDTKMYSSALKEAKASLNQIEKAQKLSASIKQDEAALKSMGMALGAAVAKEKELAAATSALGVPTKAQAKAFNEATEAAKKLDKQYATLKDDIEKNKVKLEQGTAATRNLAQADQRLAEMQAKAKGAVTQTTQALNTHKTAVAAVNEREEALNKTLAIRDKMMGSGMANMIGGAAMIAPMAKAVQTHAQFETAMLGVARQVDGARDANGKYTQTYYDMADAIQDMSERLPMAANDIATLAAAAARNGIKGKENIMAMTEVAAKASMAFDLPVEQLGDDLSKIAGLYKIPVPAIKGLGDTINYLDDQTLAKGGDIIDVMKRMGGFAEKIGASNAAAYASTLLSLGETNETAGTSMKAIVTKLGAAEKGSKSFQGAMKELGLSTSEIQKGMAVDANATIQTVMDAVNKMPKDAQTGILKDLFGLEHVGAAGKLANNLEELRKQLGLVNDEAAKGSMDKEVAARLVTLAAKWDMLKNKAVNALEKIGASVGPYLGPLMDNMGSIIGKITEWTAAHPQLTASIMMAVAGMGALRLGVGAAQLVLGQFLGPLARVRQALTWLRVGNGTISGFARISGVLGKVGSAAMRLVPIITKAFGMIKTAVFAVGRAMLGNPILLVIALIAGAAYLLWKNWDKVKVGITAAWTAVNNVFAKYPILNYIFPIIGAARLIINNWDKIKAFMSKLWASVSASVMKGVNAILNFIKGKPPLVIIKQLWDMVTNYLKGLGVKFVSIGAEIVNGLWNGLKSKFDSVISWVKDKANAIATAAKSALGIASPSRIFMSIGHDTMAGLQIGLDKNHSKVLSSVTKLAGAMLGIPMNTAEPALAGMGRSSKPLPNSFAAQNIRPVANARASNNQGAGFVFSGDINITVGKDANAYEIAQTVRREIEKVAREAITKARGKFTDKD